MADKPWVSSLSFEATFPVKGKVMQVLLCDCEEEGDLRIRVSRDTETAGQYDPKDATTFLDIHAFDPRGYFLKLRPGDWVEGDVVCFGYLRKVRTNRIEMEGNVLMDGTRLVGQAQGIDDTNISIDFGVFSANLAFENPNQMQKVLRGERIRDGTFVETDVDVDIEVRRHGHKDEIAQSLKRRFPSGHKR